MFINPSFLLLRVEVVGVCWITKVVVIVKNTRVRKLEKKELTSLFRVLGGGKSVGMDYEVVSWRAFKTENQQASLIGFTLDL